MAEVAAVTAAAAKRSLETQHVPHCEIHEIPKAQWWGIGLLEKKKRLITGSKIKLLGDYKKKHGSDSEWYPDLVLWLAGNCRTQ